MIWLLDLGNSRLKAAAWGPGLGVGDVQAWTHAAADFVPSLQRWVQGVRPGDRCWLASVAGSDVTSTVAEVLASHGNPAQRARTRPECAGVRIAYAEPVRLGVDRFLGLLAARRCRG